MQYPQIIEYKSAIQVADNFFRLKHLRPRLDARRQPVFAAGGPAVVFEMYDAQGKNYALKLFLKEQPRREENFKAINAYIRGLGDNPYLANYQYLPKELWIDGEEYPALVMDWIDGVTMSEKVAQLCEVGDKQGLAELATRFDRMSLWLLDQELAHGDIKPDNIIVTPKGELKLIDYDGMYVPTLSGTKSLELGTAEYRHPRRTARDFNRYLDDFSILVLSLSLHALAINPRLCDIDKSGDSLIFKREDYENIQNNRNISFFENSCEEYIYRRFGMLIGSICQPVCQIYGLQNILEQTAYIYDEFYLEDPFDGVPTEEEQIEKIKYSDDGGVLLYAPKGISKCRVKDGVFEIGISAFECHSPEEAEIRRGCDMYDFVSEILHYDLDEVELPLSMVTIGSSAFSYCKNLKKINLPHGLQKIDDFAFYNCTSLQDIVIPKTVKYIGNSAFEGCQNITSINIPMSVTSVNQHAFQSCSQLMSVTIPDSISYIGAGAFAGCSSLVTMTIPSSVISMGIGVFEHCKSLLQINISRESKQLYSLLIKTGVDPSVIRCI